MSTVLPGKELILPQFSQLQVPGTLPHAPVLLLLPAAQPGFRAGNGSFQAPDQAKNLETTQVHHEMPLMPLVNQPDTPG